MKDMAFDNNKSQKIAGFCPLSGKYNFDKTSTGGFQLTPFYHFRVKVPNKSF